jgi:hypothetical protein
MWFQQDELVRLKIKKKQHDCEELNMAEPKDMYQCQVANCGYIFDPDKKRQKE